MEKGHKRDGLINKTWRRCKSIGRGALKGAAAPPARGMTKKSKSWPRMAADHHHHHGAESRRVAPEGCFTVYVGPERRRFVVRTEHANHPLFKMLLDEAESEFGYDSQGPIMLPCNVDVFYSVLVEMDDSGADAKIHPGCGGFSKRQTSYHLLSPNSRMLAINHFH